MLLNKRPLPEEELVRDFYANLTSSTTSEVYIRGKKGLPLERLRALGGKEFRGVRGGDSTCAEYWLEGIVRILGPMGCSHEDKLRWDMLLLVDEAHC